MRCPLTASQHGGRQYCLGAECMLTDEAGDCLIKQALQCYVSKERTRIAQETESVNVSARIFKDGSWKPVHFTTPDEDIKMSAIEI